MYRYFGQSLRNLSVRMFTLDVLPRSKSSSLDHTHPLPSQLLRGHRFIFTFSSGAQEAKPKFNSISVRDIQNLTLENLSKNYVTLTALIMVSFLKQLSKPVSSSPATRRVPTFHLYLSSFRSLLRMYFTLAHCVFLVVKCVSQYRFSLAFSLLSIQFDQLSRTVLILAGQLL